MAPLKQLFIETAEKYTPNKSLVEKLWAEIEQRYSTKKRHYHTLVHLENLNKHLRGVKSDIEDWDTIVFSLFLP